MKCEQRYDELIQSFVDGEASEEEREELKRHLSSCPECTERLNELKKVVAYVESSSHIEAPLGFTDAVMANLPEKKSVSKWKLWMRRHPFLVAAAIFVLLMSTSIQAVWNPSEDQVVVTGPGQVIIDQETGNVLVPEGEVINGDLVVRNGQLQVEGEINGNVLLVNSESYLASAGHVSGEINEVNQALDWVWYHVKGFMKEVIAITKREE